VLGIWGDPSVTGKAVGNDLRERKKSLPVAVVLDQGGEAADELLAIYGRDGDLTDDDVARATSVLEAAGGRSHAESSAGAHLVLALTALDGLGFDDGAVVDLNDLARFVADREF
ncbi:MAG: polyprenyl synthetase family protein, partial [Acidimicrobiales bacterium]